MKLKSEFYTDTKKVNLGELLANKERKKSQDEGGKENDTKELVRAEPEFDEALGFNFEVEEDKNKAVLEI